MECAAKPPEYRYYEDGKKTIAFAGCVGVKFAWVLLSQPMSVVRPKEFHKPNCSLIFNVNRTLPAKRLCGGEAWEFYLTDGTILIAL